MVICISRFFFCFILILTPLSGFADQGLSHTQKREKLKEAIDKGILSVYDVSIETYINLQRWDLIDRILETNHYNRMQHRLPGRYYSRPLIVDQKVWIFNNAVGEAGKIFVFDPDTMVLSDILKNEQFGRYESGIRLILDDTVVISGGGNGDVDIAAIWDTEENIVKKLGLSAGHYISAIAVADERIYIGTCGGIIEQWEYDEPAFIGEFVTSEKPNVDWAVFNRKECINAVTCYNRKLIGAGQNTIFIWDMQTRRLNKKIRKAISDGIVYFYDHFLIEYKNDRIYIRDMNDPGLAYRRIKTNAFVEDLIVTSEKILPAFEGRLLITSLRHNQGLVFYDFDSMQVLKKYNVPGETLSAFGSRIFATDDNHLYRYAFLDEDRQKYSDFIKTIRYEQINYSDTIYYELLKRALRFPDVFDIKALSENFIKQKKISLEQTIRYTRISQGSRTSDQDIYGYKAVYMVKNLSENYYLLKIHAGWSDENIEISPPEKSRKDADPAESIPDTRFQSRHYTRMFFLAPGEARYRIPIILGEREPSTFLIYPVMLKDVEKKYYDDFKKAIDRENEDVSLINRFLKDELVKDWHETLIVRKNEIINRRKQGFSLFNLFK